MAWETKPWSLDEVPWRSEVVGAHFGVKAPGAWDGFVADALDIDSGAISTLATADPVEFVAAVISRFQRIDTSFAAQHPTVDEFVAEVGRGCSGQLTVRPRSYHVASE